MTNVLRKSVYYAIAAACGFLWFGTLSLPISMASGYFAVFKGYRSDLAGLVGMLALANFIAAWVLQWKVFTTRSIWLDGVILTVVTSFCFGVLGFGYSIVGGLWSGVVSYPLYGSWCMLLSPGTIVEGLTVGAIAIFVAGCSFYVTVPTGILIASLLRMLLRHTVSSPKNTLPDLTS